jgi:type VI secretion system lysozyme-like protein
MPLPLIDRLVARATSRDTAGAVRRTGVADEHQALLLDLEVLLNTLVARKPLFVDRAILHPACERIARSIVNYGTPDLTDPAFSSEGVDQTVCPEIKQIIEWFEPRLVRVTVTSVTDPSPGRQSLQLHLSASFRATGSPVAFNIDLDPGERCRIEAASE